MSLRDKYLAIRGKTAELRYEGETFTLQEMSTGRRIDFVSVIANNIAAINAHQGDPKNHPPVEQLDEVLVTVIYAVVDENGELVFSMDDYADLHHMPYELCKQIWTKAVELNEVKDIAKAVEEEKKD